MKSLRSYGSLSASILFTVFTLTANSGLAVGSGPNAHEAAPASTDIGGSEGGGLGNNGHRSQHYSQPNYDLVLNDILSIRDNLIRRISNLIITDSMGFRNYCLKNQSKFLAQGPFNQNEVVGLCSELDFNRVIPSLQSINFESTEVDRYKSSRPIPSQYSSASIQESFVQTFNFEKPRSEQIFLMKKALLTEAIKMNLRQSNLALEARSVEVFVLMTIRYLDLAE